MKRYAMILGAVLLVLALSGCGKKAVVTVSDRGVVTQVETRLPRTVAKILEDAQIALGAEDVVTPSADTKMEEEGEIVISRSNHVKLTVDGETKDVTITGGTVADLLSQEGVTLTEFQAVTPTGVTWLTDGMEVVVTSSLQVTLVHDGKEEQKELPVGTVADALEAFGVKAEELDRIEPALTEPLSHKMKIVLVRVTQEEVTETEEIAYETERKNDSSIDKGKEKTKTEGVNGEKELVYLVTYADGKEESRELLSEKVVKEPVNEVILVGTKKKSETTTKSADKEETTKRHEINRIAVPNCDDPNHGYYEIYYSDGTVEYVEY
ncbi:MAG: G5 domain-containing protein [Lachnospiraceae bacterium]|nr:G5 domain-containing protein [Lachnospiraceae bacterium]